MIAIFFRRYKGMILASLLFFYLGCVITLSFIKLECASAVSAISAVSALSAVPAAPALSAAPVVSAVSAVSTLEFNKSSMYEKIEYVVLIISSPDNKVKRDTIRQTWGNLIHNILIENDEKLYKWNHTWLGHNVKHDFIKLFFVIGTKNLEKDKIKKINNEHSRKNDLLILKSLEDSYKKLSSKLLYSLDFLSNNLKGLKYVIKCDDDSFVRVDLIVMDLETFGPGMDDPSISSYVTFKYQQNHKGLYWGYFNGDARVFLNGKWQEKDWFLCDSYLPYALGGGYIISRNIVDYISRNLDNLSQYNSEDVSMGVWTAALNGINRVHDTRFDTEWKSRGCDSNMLVRHKQSPNDMFEMYKTLVQTQGTRLCKADSALRGYYKYNWNLLPRMCCK